VAEVLSTVSPLAPTAVPDGLVLAGVFPLSADEAEEMGSGSCALLELWYEPPPDSPAYEEWLDDPDYLSIYLLPAGCALDTESTPFEPGTFGDVPSRETDFGLVEVQVGETVVQIGTTYTDDLPAMVASLQPFDVDAVLATMAEGQLMGPIVGR
jgi:hypothetical protein